MMRHLTNIEAERRLEHGVVSIDRRHIRASDGTIYRVKHEMMERLIPGETVRFVPHERPWNGEFYAGEIWLQNRRKRRAQRRTGANPSDQT